MLAATIGFAGLDTTGLNYVELVNAGQTVTNGVLSTMAPTGGVDISTYKGNAKILIFDSGNTTVNAASNTAWQIQEATALNGVFTNSGVAVTAPAATGKVEAVSVDLGSLSKAIRVTVTQQGTSTLSRVISAILVAP